MDKVDAVSEFLSLQSELKFKRGSRDKSELCEERRLVIDRPLCVILFFQGWLKL